MEVDRSKLEYKRIVEIDKELNKETNTILRVPTLINYSVGKKRFNKEPDSQDIEILQKIEGEIISYFPKDEMIHGDETERLFRAGIEHVKQLYPRRSLFFLSKLFEKCKGDNKKLFLLTSALPKLTRCV